MSISVREACLEEGSILNLIRDYFEVAGHADCFITLEDYLGGSEQHKTSLPLELAALREMTLAGKWDQVIKYLDAFSDTEDKEGLKKSKYVAHKQKYLEILYYVEADIRSKLRLGFSYYENGKLLSPHETEKVRQLMESQLVVLEPLSPSPEDYKSLKTLLSLPSISSNKEFSTWNVQSGRLDALYKIGGWISEVLFFLVNFPPQQMKDELSNSPLLRLIAKGLLYEQCERLCKARCGEGEAGLSNMLDLGGWIQQQPDSSFQLSPSELSFMVSPWAKLLSPKPQISLSVDMGRSTKEVALHQKIPATKSTSFAITNQQISHTDVNNEDKVIPLSTSIHNREVSPPVASTGEEKADEDSNMAGHKEKPINASSGKLPSGKPPPEPLSSKHPLELLSSKPPLEASSGKLPLEVSGKLSSKHPLELLSSKPPLEASSDKPPSKEDDGAAKRNTVIHDGTQDLSPPSSKDQGPPLNPTPPKSEATFLPSTTPLFKTGRDSSTPKNIKASRASLKASPPSSPIVDKQSTQLSTQVTFEGYQKRIDFHEWPRVSLRSTLSDLQVVRSVAFSGSGKIVAVGANSQILRLCYTSPLLEKRASKDIDVIYQHPRYHKSSIYCLAWFGDRLLASGSNDHSIRLLTCLTSHNDSELKVRVQKPLSLHKGTIREIVFTPEGFLASGGGGSPEIQVTDINTSQTIISLSGHTDQVLSLGILPGGLLASGGQDKTVLLWDLRTRLPVSSISIGLPVASLSSLKETMTTSHLDGTCSLYDLNMFKCLSTYTPHTHECRSVRHCPRPNQHNWVLSGSYDGSICLTDINSLQWTKLCQHTDKVIQCRWHPDGKLFASTGTDKKAQFWSMD